MLQQLFLHRFGITVAFLLTVNLWNFPVVFAETIFKAISKDNCLELTELLNGGQDPNALTENGLPALLFAWQHEHINSFEVLLEMGATPHQVISQNMQITVDDELLTIEHGSLAIALIVQYSRLRPGFLEVALRYLRKPNQVDGSGKTIYHHHALANFYAFDNDSVSLMMLNAGVDRDLTDEDGFSAVRRYAKRFFKLDVVTGQLSLYHGIWTFFLTGSDLLQVAPDGTTLFEDLRVITQSDHPRKRDFWWNEKNTNELLKIVESQLLPKDKMILSEIEDFGISMYQMFEDLSTQQVAYWAELFPHHSPDPDDATVQQYLDSGRSLDHQDEAGITFLWAALQMGNRESFAKLIDLGANPDLRLTGNLGKFSKREEFNGKTYSFGTWFGVRGETVLLAACSYPFRRKEFIRPALAVTKEINQTDELDRNLLHRLLYHPLLHGQEDLLKDLINAGVNINAQTISGATPCHVAVAMNPTVIPVLVEAGSDPSIRNRRGQSVEDLLRVAIKEGWSRQEDYQRILDWLVARTPPVQP